MIKSMIRGIVRFFLGLLQWAALSLGAFFLGMLAVPFLESWQLERQWLEKEAAAELPSPRETTIDTSSGAERALPAKTPSRLLPGAVLGRVQIDRLEIDAIVLEGTDETVLRRAVGHFPGTRLPWQSGTVGLAAHRDSFFRRLEHVAEGDVIRLVTEYGTFVYEVTELKIVDPSEVDVLQDRGSAGLTLVTCYPFSYVGAAPRRSIVMASLASGSPS